jgi:hypothetical protein
MRPNGTVEVFKIKSLATEEKCDARSAVLAGLVHLRKRPALKRRAIFRLSRWDKATGNNGHLDFVVAVF